MNVNKSEFKRTIPISRFKALSKAQDPKNLEFVLHVKDEYDYRFICDVREALFDSVKACYFQKENENLPIYVVPEALKKYTTGKKEAKNKQFKIPPETYYREDENSFKPHVEEPVDKKMEHLTISKDELPVMTGGHRPTFAKDGNLDVTLDDFEIKKVIGRGSFGKVFLVQQKTSGNYYAMKSLRKDVILETDQVQATKLERDILLKASHPFLVGMSYVF